MKIRYNPFMAWLFLGISGLALIIYVLGLSLGIDIPWYNFIPLVVCFYVGYRYLRGTYFEITETQIVVYALTGQFHKTYQHNGLHTIHLNGRLSVNINGVNRSVRIARWMAHKNDWRELEVFLRQNDLTSEIHDI